MTIGTALLILLIVMLVLSVPAWQHSRDWGVVPSGALGALLIVVLILFLMGRI